ncbi:Conserved_hypothetical protein [Hexamita inflata]|uniref:Clathrin light chain n=1 Tax=Hexamita inflata TaxID=28002 RepID=A0AA86TTC7_9EUKA|nr:Conserved hypothetical protein [Hexamita inflata]
MADFDPFADIMAPTNPAPAAVQEPLQEPVQENVQQPVIEQPAQQQQAAKDDFADLMQEQPAKPEEAQEEQKQDLFGSVAKEQDLPQDHKDVDRYNELLMKYERHLLSRENEQKAAVNGLQQIAAEYRGDWQQKADKEAEKAVENQKREWEEMQKMVNDDKVGSWQKIGKLAGSGEGRIFEVLKAKIQDEEEKEEKKE